ncbi:Taxilin family [Carpediemonas membranifera]|uniref:Taxilin family n=1 Tax=Carpediemonas membranifera TaxID=201153 RepID=A0A8J6AWI6_9EUKA|nr:Taxilin family [Carpediemonas membranifera]|eukprot:KAG9394265.1 Taxilin family [Carpediemonas membranifera]
MPSKAELEASLADARATSDKFRKLYQDMQKQHLKSQADAKHYQAQAEAAQKSLAEEKRIGELVVVEEKKKSLEAFELNKKLMEAYDKLREETTRREEAYKTILEERDGIIKAKEAAIQKFTESFDKFKDDVDSRFAVDAELREENEKLRANLKMVLEQLEAKDGLITKQKELYDKEHELVATQLDASETGREKLFAEIKRHAQRAADAVKGEEEARAQLMQYVKEFEGVKDAVRESHEGIDKMRQRLSRADSTNAKLNAELTDAKKQYIEVSEKLIQILKEKREVEGGVQALLKKNETLEKLCRTLKERMDAQAAGGGPQTE